MSKISIHDIPINTFMKYYFNDKDADFISKNARYQPKMVEWKTNKIFQFAFNNGVVNSANFVLKLPVFPDISTGTYLDITKSSDIIFNKLGLKLASPTVKESIKNEINYENGKVRSKYSRLKKINELDAAGNNENFNIISGCDYQIKLTDATKLYYNPIKDKLTTVLGNISLYKYYGVIANKYFYPLELQENSEVSIENFLVDYTPYTTPAAQTNGTAFVPKYNLDSYFKKSGYRIENEIIKNSVSPKVYIDKTNHIEYYAVINLDNKIIGKIYILPVLNTIKTNGQTGDYEFEDRYSPNTNSTADGTTQEENTQNKEPYKTVSFNLKNLPLSPVMKYNSFMRDIKNISKYDLNANELTYVRVDTIGSDKNAYHDYISYMNTPQLTIENIDEPTNIYAGLLSKCITYESSFPSVTLNKKQENYQIINSENNGKYIFGMVPDASFVDSIRTNANTPLFLNEEEFAQESIDSSTWQMSNDDIIKNTDINEPNKNITLDLIGDANNSYTVYYKSENGYTSINVEPNTNKSITFEHNSKIYVYPNAIDGYKSVKCVLTCTNDNDDSKISITRNNQNNFEFNVYIDSSLTVEFERQAKNSKNVSSITFGTDVITYITLVDKVFIASETSANVESDQIVKLCKLPSLKNRIGYTITVAESDSTKKINKRNADLGKDITDSLQFVVRPNKKYTININWTNGIEPITIPLNKKEFLYFINNIYNKEKVIFYNTNNIYNITPKDGDMFNTFITMVNSAYKIINSKANYFLDCNKNQLDTVSKFLKNKSPIFEFARSNGEDVKLNKYYLFKINGVHAYKKESGEFASDNWNSVYALRVVSTNFANAMTVEVVPLVVYLQIVLNYLYCMYAIAEKLSTKKETKTKTTKELTQFSLEKTLIYNGKKYTLKKNAIANKFFEVGKAIGNSIVIEDSKATVMSEETLEKAQYFGKTKVHIVNEGIETSEGISSKERKILKDKSVELAATNQTELSKSCEKDNYEILIYSKNLQKQLVSILQTDQRIINNGDQCHNRITNEKYFGFIRHSNVDVHYIDYYNISPAENRPVSIPNSAYKLSNTEKLLIEQKVLNENPIKKILNYNSYFTDNSEIKDIIKQKESTLWINNICSDKEYNERQSINSNKISETKYVQNYIDYSDIFDKAKTLYLEYVYAAIGPRSNVNNESFYKNSVSSYIDTLNYIYKNNQNSKFKNEDVIFKKKISFNNDNENKKVFLTSLKLKFGIATKEA